MAQTHQSQDLAEDLDLGVIWNKGKVPPGLVLGGSGKERKRHGPFVAQRAGDHPTSRRGLSYEAVQAMNQCSKYIHLLLFVRSALTMVFLIVGA